MSKAFTELVRYKNMFEALEEARMINLDNCPGYWAVLRDIDEIYKNRVVCV